MEKITSVPECEGREKGTFLDALQGKTLYIDRELYESARRKITSLNIKKVTGMVVSADPKVAAATVVYYRNFNKKVFSIPKATDKVCNFLNDVILLLVSNVPDSTVYEWTEEMTNEAPNVSFPLSTEIERFLSDITYLCQGYTDVDYKSTIIQTYSPLTRYVFSYISIQRSRKESSKNFIITPEFYQDVEKITGLNSLASSIKAIVTIANLIFHVLQEDKGQFVEYLKYLKDEKSVNITRVKKNLSTEKGARHVLLHEWLVVCNNEELTDLLGNEWSRKSRDQRRVLDDFRRGKKSSVDLEKIDTDIRELAGNAAQVVYSRQKKLHDYMKNRRELLLEAIKKDPTLKRVSITPTRDAWRNLCFEKDDKMSLSTITIPLIQAGFISTEKELKSFISLGKTNRTLDALTWTEQQLTAEPWYMALVESTDPDNNNSLKRELSLKALTRIESVTVRNL
jgi:hypothetical protein